MKLVILGLGLQETREYLRGQRVPTAQRPDMDGERDVDLHILQRVAGYQYPAVTLATCIPIRKPCWRPDSIFGPVVS